MAYWDELCDSHIKVWNTPLYKDYWRIKDEINIEGYRCDMLKHSDVIYIGSCDAMSCIMDRTSRWPELLHVKMYADNPLIVLGTVTSGLQTIVRRLYSYIKNFGPPKIVYMTLPRFDNYEFVNKSGICYTASDRIGTAHFCRQANLVNDEEHNTWLAQLDANIELSNSYNIRYLIEERFAFVETLCEKHKITLRWTFNPSDACIDLLHKHVDIFEDISDFMKTAFVGLPTVKDHMLDRSIGPDTNREIFNVFTSPSTWDFEALVNKSKENYAWASMRYGKSIVKA